jgi:hypothetical protein
MSRRRSDARLQQRLAKRIYDRATQPAAVCFVATVIKTGRQRSQPLPDDQPRKMVGETLLQPTRAVIARCRVAIVARAVVLIRIVSNIVKPVVVVGKRRY